MNQKTYLDELKKHLHSLDEKSRNEIITEIQGLILDSNCSDDELISRFGDPETLASQYVGKPAGVKPSFYQRYVSKFFNAVSLVVVVLLVSIILFFVLGHSDDFDYADEQAEELNQNLSSWQSVPWDKPLTIDIAQAQVVLYWHDNDSIAWDCGDGEYPEIGEIVSIKQKQCLLFLPLRDVEIKSNQAELVVVRPQTNINANIHQTILRIASNGSAFQLNVEKDASILEPVLIDKNAVIRLNIVASQAIIGEYEYE